MADKREIIEALEEDIGDWGGDTSGTVIVPAAFLVEVLRLLKDGEEKEPRVLTREEVLTGIGEGYFENWLREDDGDPEMFMAGPCVYLNGYILSNTDGDYVDYTNPDSSEGHYNKRYGLRVWSSEPTEEQRKAAEWDG